MNKGGTGKWAPKLTFEERCGFLAAILTGYSTTEVAAVSGLNPGTVTRLFDTDYRAYANVKAEFQKLGRTAFIDQYFTQALQDRMGAGAAGAQVAALTCTPGV